MKKPSPEQIEEWFDSSVARYFHHLIASLSKEILEEKANQGYDAQSAEHLMAHRANLCGLETAFAQVEAVFKDKSFDELEVEEDGESVGDTSLGGSGPH